MAFVHGFYGDLQKNDLSFTETKSFIMSYKK